MIRMYRTALLLSCVAAFAAKCAAATAVSTDFQNDAFTGLPLAANSGQSLRINVGERATEASLLAAKNAKLERLQLGKIMAENKLQCVEGAGTGRSRLFIASPEPELLDEDKRLLDSMNQRSDGTWDSVVTPPFLKSRYSRGCDEVAKAMIALAGVPRYTQYNYGGRLECKVDRNVNADPVAGLPGTYMNCDDTITKGLNKLLGVDSFVCYDTGYLDGNLNIKLLAFEVEGTPLTGQSSYANDPVPATIKADCDALVERLWADHVKEYDPAKRVEAPMTDLEKCTMCAECPGLRGAYVTDQFPACPTCPEKWGGGITVDNSNLVLFGDNETVAGIFEDAKACRNHETKETADEGYVRYYNKTGPNAFGNMVMDQEVFYFPNPTNCKVTSKKFSRDEHGGPTCSNFCEDTTDKGDRSQDPGCGACCLAADCQTPMSSVCNTLDDSYVWGGHAHERNDYYPKKVMGKPLDDVDYCTSPLQEANPNLSCREPRENERTFTGAPASAANALNYRNVTFDEQTNKEATDLNNPEDGIFTAFEYVEVVKKVPFNNDCVTRKSQFPHGPRSFDPLLGNGNTLDQGGFCTEYSYGIGQGPRRSQVPCHLRTNAECEAPDHFHYDDGYGAEEDWTEEGGYYPITTGISCCTLGRWVPPDRRPPTPAPTPAPTLVAPLAHCCYWMCVSNQSRALQAAAISQMAADRANGVEIDRDTDAMKAWAAAGIVRDKCTAACEDDCPITRSPDRVYDHPVCFEAYMNARGGTVPPQTTVPPPPSACPPPPPPAPPPAPTPAPTNVATGPTPAPTPAPTNVATGDDAGIVGVIEKVKVTMVLKITLPAGLNITALSKADYDTVVADYQASAAAAAGIAVDKIERVEFYLDGKLIETPTQRRDRRAEGEVTMKIIFKESYTEAEANTAAASFNAAVAAGTVGKVTVTLADGKSYETTFESVEVEVETTFVVTASASSITAGVATVFVVAAAAASLF